MTLKRQFEDGEISTPVKRSKHGDPQTRRSSFERDGFRGTKRIREDDQDMPETKQKRFSGVIALDTGKGTSLDWGDGQASKRKADDLEQCDIDHAKRRKLFIQSSKRKADMLDASDTHAVKRSRHTNNTTSSIGIDARTRDIKDPACHILGWFECEHQILYLAEISYGYYCAHALVPLEKLERDFPVVSQDSRNALSDENRRIKSVAHTVYDVISVAPYSPYGVCVVPPHWELPWTTNSKLDKMVAVVLVQWQDSEMTWEILWDAYGTDLEEVLYNNLLEPGKCNEMRFRSIVKQQFTDKFGHPH